MANERKSAQLGMPFGTAAGQLRKLVLFDLLQRHGENTCFRCGESIASAAELSLEHKRPWLDKDPALFWDLGNIAFSHLICNSSACDRTNSGVAGGLAAYARRRKCPDGMSWCYACRDFLPMGHFSKGSRPNGLRNICKRHNNENKERWRREKRARQRTV